MAESAAWLFDPMGESTYVTPSRTRPVEANEFYPVMSSPTANGS
jgi:hypothetical protein